MKRVISWSYVAVVFYATRWNYHFLRATGSARGFPELPPLAFWLLLFTAMLIPVVPHEAGHWVAGVAAGWRGMRFRIGPYALVRAARGWKIRWIKWDLGGAVTFSPLGLAGFGKADALLTVGGPVASVLFGAACGWIAWQAKTAAVLWFFGITAQFSMLGVLELLPRGSGLVRSDGYWLWQVIRGDGELGRRQRYMLVNISGGTDLRPRNWPRDLMGPVIEGPFPCEDRHEGYLIYMHLMDAADPAAAFLWLSEVLKDRQKSDPSEYVLEAAYYVGLYTRDRALAGKWLGSTGKDYVQPWIRLRAEAAVALAWGDGERAERLANQAIAQLAGAFPCGLCEYERARLGELLEQTAVCRMGQVLIA